MAEPRSFYGGEPVTGGVSGSGEISAGKYTGPEAHVQAPWKCPACLVENVGPLPFGCSSCGAGKPGYHVDPPPPTAAQRTDPQQGLPTVIDRAWAPVWEKLQFEAPTRATQVEDLLQEAFLAGWMAGAQQQAHQTMQATPLTADARALAPEARPQRTIIAALELFRDQVLGFAEDEIASGEWCSLAEVGELIERMRAQL